MATVKGGEKLQAKLDEMARGLSNPGTLQVGFLEGATYPDGTSVAMVAAIQNYGAPAAGIPPRPFFSDMIASKEKTWPPILEKTLLARNYDARASLMLVGEVIRGQLQQAIRDFNGVPLAPATVERKGFDKQLIDTAHMLMSADYKVK